MRCGEVERVEDGCSQLYVKRRIHELLRFPRVVIGKRHLANLDRLVEAEVETALPRIDPKRPVEIVSERFSLKSKLEDLTQSKSAGSVCQSEPSLSRIPSEDGTLSCMTVSAPFGGSATRGMPSPN